MATKRKTQHSSQLHVESQSLERLFEKLLLKDSFPPPKAFYTGKNIEEHLMNVRRYIQATNIINPETQIAVLLNSLDEDVQIILFSQPQFQQNSENYEWICEKLVTLFRQKSSAISPLTNLLQMKQASDQSLKTFASGLRIAAYKTMKEIPENIRETYLLSAFLNGMNNRILAKAIEALKPKAMEEALKLAEKEERNFQEAHNNHVRGIENEEVTVSKNDLRLVLNQLSLLQKQVSYLISLQQNNQVVNKERNVFQDSRNFRMPLPKESGGRFHTNQITSRQPINCYRCNEKGHIARNCRKILSCSVCKGNHLLKNCPRNNNHFRRLHSSVKTSDKRSLSDVESVRSFKKENFEETSSQMTENDCFVLTKERKNPPVNLSIKNKVLKRPYEKPLPTKAVEGRVQEWVNFIEGHGRKPKHSAPTLISNTRVEPAANKPLVRGLCEGKEEKLFLDSGAEVNVIDRKLFNQLQTYSGNKIPFQSSRGSISCANGSKIATYGLANMKIHIGDTRANIKFTVADDIFPRVIIGIRGMRTLHIQLNPSTSCAIVGNSTVVPFISKVSPQSVWAENFDKSALGVGDRLRQEERLH